MFDAYLAPYRRYADFQGRARRSEYWRFLLFLTAVSVVLTTVIGGLHTVAGPATAALLALLLLSVAPLVAVRVRRLHDVGRSGWWLLIGLVPLLGALVLLVFDLLPGQDGPNRFGADPRGDGQPLIEVFE